MNKLRSGSAFLLTMLLVAVISTIALAVGRLMIAELRMTTKLEESTAAYFAAEAGIEDGLMRLKEVPNTTILAEPITQVNITDPSRTVPAAKDKYYQLKITNTASQTGNPTDLSHGAILLKDGILEISPTPTLTDLTLNYIVYNADTQTLRPIKYGVEVIKILGDNITRIFCPDLSVSIPMENISNFGCSRPALDDTGIYHIYIPSQGFEKIRIRPWGYSGTGNLNEANSESDPSEFHIRYSITSSEPTVIQQPFITIESTGFFGQTQRTLQAKIDTSSGRIIGLFDFTIFQGGE